MKFQPFGNNGFGQQAMGMASANPFGNQMGFGQPLAQPAQPNPFGASAGAFGQAMAQPQATSPFGQPNPFAGQAQMAGLNNQVQQMNLNQTTNPFGQPAQANAAMPNMVKSLKKIFGIPLHIATAIETSVFSLSVLVQGVSISAN